MAASASAPPPSSSPPTGPRIVPDTPSTPPRTPRLLWVGIGLQFGGGFMAMAAGTVAQELERARGDAPFPLLAATFGGLACGAIGVVIMLAAVVRWSRSGR